MKIDLKKLIEEFKNYLNYDEKPSLHKKHTFKINKNEDPEVITGAIVIIAIIIILISIIYYFMIFAPSMQELNDHKTSKINEVNTLFKDNLTNTPTHQSLLAEINRASTVEEVEAINVQQAAYPVLKNQLLNNLDELKDKYNRVQIKVDNTTTIMNTKNATQYINTAPTNELANMTIEKVDTVIIPITINRKQAASGLITENDVVDIYTTINIQTETNTETQTNTSDENNTNTTNISEVESKENSTSSKIVGGSQVVSILRSKDAGEIESDIQVKNENNSSNINLDIEEVLESKAAGVYDKKEFNILVERYAKRLADYERTSNIGDLDAQYIIMLEVPRSSVDMITSNMDNIILTIPTYDAPSWVNIKS